MWEQAYLREMVFGASAQVSYLQYTASYDTRSEQGPSGESTALSQMSSTPPTYIESCKLLGFDPHKPFMPGRLGWARSEDDSPLPVLRSWQVKFLA